MKTNKILYLIVLVLLVVAGYFYFTDTSGTISNQEGAKFDFAIEDTATIDKIFIVNPKGQHVTINKMEDGWKINGQYNARPDNIRLLMKTFSRIELKAPVSKSAFKNVVKNIATNSTKVEIYQGGDKPSKVYYVGSATMDQRGTYMLLETAGVKSTQPGIMHIPGFRGFLTSRFFADADQWRDAAVFKYDSKDIKNIAVTYYEKPEESFVIRKNGETTELLDIENNVINDFNQDRVNEYVDRYKSVYYEMIDTESSPERIDSVIASQPYFKIEVEDVAGKSTELIAYHMANYREIMDETIGEPFEFDVDRMYAHLNKDLFVYIQFATFDNLTVPKGDLLVK